MTQLSKKAYAKINLALEIISRRDNGYHDIRTVMHKISLCDDITVEFGSGSGVSVFCDTDVLCKSEENLAYKAATSYYEKCAEKKLPVHSVKISIKKRIPFGAGLGGGSADCACVLDLLNQKEKALDDTELFDIAQRLGSDVPFCLDRYTCAYACGTGTELTALDGLNRDLYVLITKPDVFFETKSIYSMYDSTQNPFGDKQNSLEIKRVIEGKSESDIFSLFVNDFEKVAFSLSEDVKVIKNTISKYANAALMSGSGPSVYGLFSDKSSLEKAKIALEELGFDINYVCKMNTPEQ